MELWKIVKVPNGRQLAIYFNNEGIPQEAKASLPR
jgi:hypothetical protein